MTVILESSEMTIQVSSVKVTKELQTGQTVSALCGYTAAKDDELTLEAGQTLRILSVGQDGWTEAFTGSSVGWIPGSVTLEPISLDEEESPLPSVDLLDHYRLQTLFKNADSLDPLHAATSSASSYCSTSLTTAPSLLPRDEKLELRATLTTAFIEEETRFMDELEAVLDTQSASELCSMWLPLKIHKALIESLQDLLNFHQVLTQSLRLVAQAEPQDQLTGGYILDFIPFFSEVYSEYKAQLPKMMTHAIESSSDFSKKSFGSLYRRSSTGLNSVVTPVLQFTASMSRPAQRMFKLVQFLRRLLEVTPLDHEDRELSLVAWRASRDAIVAIDSQVKTIENHETVHQLVKQVDNWDGPGLEHYGSLLRHGTLALGDRKRIHHVYLFERLLLILKSKTLSQTGPSSDGKKPKLFGKSPTPPLQTQLPQQQVTRFKVIHKIPLSMSVIKQVSTNDSINETFFRIAFCPLDTPTIRSTASDETTQVKVLDFYAINRAVRTQWTDALNKSIIYDRPKFTPTETYESLNRPKSKKRESSTGGGLRRVLSLFGSMSRLNLNEEKTSSGSLERSLVSSSNPVTTPEPPLPAMSVVELVSQEKEEAAPVLLNQVETEVTPLTEFPALNEEPRPSSSIESIQEPPAESIIPDKDLPALPELVDFDAYEALYRDYQAKIVEVEGLKVRLDTLFLTRHPLGLSSAPLKFDASIQTDLEVSTAETETETTTTESNVQAIFEALEQKEENVEVSSEKLKVSIKPPVTHKKDKKTVVPQAHKAKAGSKKQQSKPISIVTKTLSPSNIAQTGSTPSMSSSGFTSPPNSPSRPVSPTRTPPRNRKTTLDRPQTPSSVSRPTVSSTAKQTRRTSR